MVLHSWTITWGEYVSDCYTYGSVITFSGKDGVVFENAGMAPGTVMKEWYSKTDFAVDRREPALPLIDGEGSYRLYSDIDEVQGGNVLLRLVFYDRYNKEIDSISTWEVPISFRCPLPTYSYKIQLICGGAVKFRFRSLRLVEESGEE